MLYSENDIKGLTQKYVMIFNKRVYQINTEQISMIIEHWEEQTIAPEEKQLFLCKDGETYIALDNTSGNAFMEEFQSPVSAVLYLFGYADLEDLQTVEENFLEKNKSEVLTRRDYDNAFLDLD